VVGWRDISYQKEPTMPESWIEYGVKRPAPYEGVISNSSPYMSKGEAERTAESLNETSSLKGTFVVVQRTHTVEDWEPAP
jgi:hypothetical protein